MAALAKCHYEVLGVKRNATIDDIKKAYKKLALQMHPDKNLDRTMEAKTEFQALQQAYKTLSNPLERARYDRHPTAKPKAQDTKPSSNGAPPTTPEGNHNRSSSGSGFYSDDSDSDESGLNDSDSHEFYSHGCDSNDCDPNDCDSSESDSNNNYCYDSDSNDSYSYDSPSAAKKPKRESTNSPTGAIKAIKDLNLFTHQVTIRARVTNKYDVMTRSSSYEEGTYFKMDLLDDSGEIRLIGFNTSANSFYDRIKVNDVYYISRFKVQTAKKQYTSIEHDYELIFDDDTQIVPCVEDTSDIPHVAYDFVTIADIKNVAAGKIIDVIGVCKSVGDCQNTTVVKKRELVLVDQSGKEIALTLWGKAAEEFSDDKQPVIAVKGATVVSDFGGKCLSCPSLSFFQVNPDLEQARALRQWYDSEGPI